jgi:hypothetical protein
MAEAATVQTLLRAASAAQRGTLHQLPQREVYAAYVRCTQMLSPEALTLAVRRYCESGDPAEVVAFARLLHRIFRQAGAQARVWMRLDPCQASGVQIAQLYRAAYREYPWMLDRLFRSEGATPAARRAVAGITAEAVCGILGRPLPWH